jgi:hypothetical protein
LQARYPALIASAGVPKNSTFAASGLRAVQDGRQKIPVVRTAVTNTWSYRASLDMNARSIS